MASNVPNVPSEAYSIIIILLPIENRDHEIENDERVRIAIDGDMDAWTIPTKGKRTTSMVRSPDATFTAVSPLYPLIHFPTSM